MADVDKPLATHLSPTLSNEVRVLCAALGQDPNEIIEYAVQRAVNERLMLPETAMILEHHLRHTRSVVDSLTHQSRLHRGD